MKVRIVELLYVPLAREPVPSNENRSGIPALSGINGPRRGLFR
jgi:hypothetical protein